MAYMKNDGYDMIFYKKILCSCDMRFAVISTWILQTVFVSVAAFIAYRYHSHSGVGDDSRALMDAHGNM